MNADNQPMDRHGFCPHCKKSWNGGDIKAVIKAMDIHQFKTDKEITALAEQFGWTEENKKQFSNVRVYEMSGLTKRTFYECPECSYVYDAETSAEFNHISDARADFIFYEEQIPSDRYKNLTIEDIEAAMQEFFGKEEEKLGMPKVESISDTHYKVTDKEAVLVISKEVWEKAMKDAIKKPGE